MSALKTLEKLRYVLYGLSILHIWRQFSIKEQIIGQGGAHFCQNSLIKYVELLFKGHTFARKNVQFSMIKNIHL